MIAARTVGRYGAGALLVVGGAVGLGVLVTVAASAGDGAEGAQGLIDGYSAAYWVATGLLAVAAAAAGFLSGRGAPPAEMPAGEKSPKKNGERVDPDVSRSTQG